MDFRRAAGNTITRGLVIFLCSLLFPTVLFSQQSDPRENRAIVGRDYVLKVQTDIPYSYSIRAELPPLHPSVKVRSGPSVRAYRRESITEGRREYQTMAELNLVLRVEESGIFHIPGIVLQGEGYRKELDPFYLMCFRWDEYQNSYPLNVQWKELPESLYQGEFLPMVLEVLYTDSIIFPDDIRLNNPPGGRLETITLAGDIQTMRLTDELQVYRYPLESWLFSSLDTGQVSVPAGSVVINGLTRSIPSIKLEILELPEEVQQTAAVGTFQRSFQGDFRNVRLGDRVEMRVLIQGRGNLPNLHQPDPILEGWELIDRSESLEIQPHPQWGYQGRKTFIFLLHSTEEGHSRIQWEPFPFLNKETEGIQWLEGSTQSYEVAPPPVKNSIIETPLMPVTELLRDKVWFSPYSGKAYLMLIPFLLGIPLSWAMAWNKKRLAILGVVFLLFGSSQWDDQSREKLSEAQRAYTDKDYSLALDIYNSLERDYKENSVFHYNWAILQWKMGHDGEAQWAMRKALMLRPGTILYQNTLEEMNHEMELEMQYHGMLYWKQNWFFILFLLSTALLLTFLSLHIYHKRTKTLLYFLVVLSFWVLSSFSMIYYLSSNRTTQVVVMEDTDMKKISGQLAKPWVDLKEGTSLEIETSYGDYLFVRTGYGLEGWVIKDHVRTLLRNEYE